MKHALAALLLGALVALPPAPCRAQIETREGIALNNQIAELRRQLDLMRDQLARGGAGSGGSSLGGYRAAPAPGPAPGSDLAAQLLQRVNQLEDEVRRLRGRVDESDNARQRQGEDLSKQIGDLNFRLEGAAGGGARTQAGAAPAPSAAPASPPAPPAAPVRRTPEIALQEGNAALARRDYPAAEASAREVLSGPRTPRSIDANFLLAQSLAGRKDWPKAAVAYDDTYNRSKTGAHAADSLLGLAVALTNLSESKAACETLDKMHAEFPSPRPDLRDQAAAARQRANCR